MDLETKATTRIITDESDDRAYRRFLNEHKKLISIPTIFMWRKQGLLVTTETAEKAFKAGKVPKEWSGPWNELTRLYVEDPVMSAWNETIETAGDRIAKNVNRIQVKAFNFNSTLISVKKWIDTEGGRLIVDLTKAQLGSVNALLQHQIALGVTSPYILAQRIKPIVGLTVREVRAVGNTIAQLTKEGLNQSLITKKAEEYAKTLHRNRAIRIAQTEMANAYNFGQMDSIEQAIKAGELLGEVEKNWIAGGPNPCPICIKNDASKPIPIDENFPSGHERPTAHPRCACSQSYSVRR